MRSKVKLSLIENETSRKITFKKRKKGMMKKLDELVKLCDIKACGIVFSPYDPIPEAWPSREGVEEVVSKFKELSMTSQTKKMMDQETLMHQRINKEKKKLHKLCEENRESEIQDLMFSIIKGEIMEYHLNEKDIQDLRVYMDKYHNQLARRIEILAENGESSSLAPPVVAADADARAAPIGFYDQIQYQNVNQNQQESVQFNYQRLIDFYDQIPQKLHAMNISMNINSNQNMNLDLNQNIDLNLDLNQIPNKKQSFMDLLRGYPQQMSDDGEHTHIPSMDDNHHQASTVNLVTTGHMSSITIDVADVCASNITNDP